MRLTLIDVMLTSVLLLCKLFAIAIYRRHSQTERNSRNAAENLWHVRQLTAALLADAEGRNDLLFEGVKDAPTEVVLHLLRVQSGRHYNALLDAAEQQGKFTPLQKSLFSTEPAKTIRALQQIEICKTPECIRSVDRLMRSSEKPEIQLQAAWTLQRMGSVLTPQEILNLTARCKAERPQMHAAVSAAFARNFAGSPDDLFEIFAEYGESTSGIDMLAQIDSDDAIWRLLVLSGSADPEIGETARARLSDTRLPLQRAPHAAITSPANLVTTY